MTESKFWQSHAPVFVAGGSGLVGRAIVNKLADAGIEGILSPTSRELDLTDRASVEAFIELHRPALIIDAAARVGGILANNSFPAEFLSQNLQIQLNLMDTAARFGVRKFLFLGSSCIYPRLAEQPMSEDALMSGPLEQTNSAYAVAKIAGVEQVKSYRRQFNLPWISAMPTNIYGPGDNFHSTGSHVIPGLMRRLHEAKELGEGTVSVWGTGRAMREFLYSADLADALLFLVERYDSDQIINVGSGQEVAIEDLARKIAGVVGYQGDLSFDASKPDGTPRKLLDSSRLNNLGWQANTSLRDGLTETYNWFLENSESFRGR